MYKPGKQNFEADALSRLPLAEPDHTNVMDSVEVSDCLGKKHAGWIGFITCKGHPRRSTDGNEGIFFT